MNFELHRNLQSKLFIADLPLCRILLEDEFHYPWIFLVPRRPDLLRLIDVPQEDQSQLWKELDMVQKVLWQQFDLTQLNVAAIGNKTPQLHIHIIGRREGDPAWPNTVWDHPVRQTYLPAQKKKMILTLKTALMFIAGVVEVFNDEAHKINGDGKQSKDEQT